MATTTNLKLTDEQRAQIAKALRIDPAAVPDSLGVVAVSPEAGQTMGMPEDMQSRFSPALIVT